jgi:hypothetical protein
VGFLYWYVILFKLTRSHVPEPRFRVVSFLLFLVRISFGFLTGLTVLLSILPTPHGGASAPFLTAAIGFYVVYRVSRQEVKKGRGAFFPFTGGIEPRGQDVAAR